MTIKLDFKYSGVDIKSFKVPEKIRKMEIPSFVTHKPDFKSIKETAKKYSKYRNIVVIGNGGSINNFIALYNSLGKYRTDKNVFILNTMDPDAINGIKRQCPKKETLIVPVTKSGTNICPIEAMLAFDGYTQLPIISENTGSLVEITKRRKIEFIKHPDIGGRFAGRTSCAFGPAELIGLPIEKINKGFLSIYRKCNPIISVDKNPALQLSVILFMLERKGYDEIFCAIYSSRLSGIIPLITQLMHESVCKEGKGQTLIGAEGPEIHHHSTQRFFGGRKNMVGFFIRLEHPDDEKSRVKISKELMDIPLRDGLLGNLNNVPYSKALDFEFRGVREHTIRNKIPHVVLSVDKITSETLGELMGFWQHVAVYSAILRDVNPFDQPEVEFAKKTSFRLIKSYV